MMAVMACLGIAYLGFTVFLLIGYASAASSAKGLFPPHGVPLLLRLARPDEFDQSIDLPFNRN